MRNRRRGRWWDLRRREILERDGYRCRECGRPGRLEVDHVVPLKAGGSDDHDNLRALCKDCHLARHRKPVGPKVRAWRGLVRELLRG